MSLVLGPGLGPVGHRGWRETCRGCRRQQLGHGSGHLLQEQEAWAWRGCVCRQSLQGQVELRLDRRVHTRALQTATNRIHSRTMSQVGDASE